MNPSRKGKQKYTTRVMRAAKRRIEEPVVEKEKKMRRMSSKLKGRIEHDFP
jgi:hypothetical protein